jgi:hypothetical protein
VKLALKVLGGLAVLALLAWTTMFLYWHLGLRAAIRSFEEHAADVPRPWDPLSDSEAYATVRGSGCRGLPHLVRAIASSTNPEYQRGLSLLVFFAATKADSPEADGKLQDVSLLAAEDTPQEHAKKVDAIRAWWKQEGHVYHQWWRVWSANCGSR